MIVSCSDQSQAEPGQQGTQLGSSVERIGDLLQRPETMQHPELGQGHADFGLVVIVFIVSGAGLETYSFGVLSRETLFRLGERRVRLNGEHLVNVKNFEEIRQPAAEMSIRRLPKDGIGLLCNQLVQRHLLPAKLDQ